MLNPTIISLSLSIQNKSTILSPIQFIVGIHSCSDCMVITVRILIAMSDRMLDENEDIYWNK